MPTTKIRTNRAKSAKPRAKAASANAQQVARTVVANLQLLAPLEPSVVRTAFAGVFPRRGSAKIRDIAELIAGLGREPTRTPSRTESAVPKAPDHLTAQANSARAEVQKSGAIVSSRDLCDGLHFTRQALSRAVLEHRIFSVNVGKARLYPKFFADAELDRQQLEAVAKELGDLPGWSKWQFFTTPKASLGGVTPLLALKRGRFNEVRRAAIGFLDR